MSPLHGSSSMDVKSVSFSAKKSAQPFTTANRQGVGSVWTRAIRTRKRLNVPTRLLQTRDVSEVKGPRSPRAQPRHSTLPVVLVRACPSSWQTSVHTRDDEHGREQAGPG